ncbi:DUF6318 family protein [Paenarthrobacter nicotinovorans]|uniref:DUF6318 family protein n=1 Tax=Paenarthrobacter nicotinovorans TaxID=29320 RepID=UPI0019C3F5FE|nr:DUF6318 family protein [Paenarthrobacter nicotinovorans]MBP2394951.1 hypothetical protein [Paenarthrobacter nicotinovorans]UKE98889.1 DUF6318 family protein [Paenarthrobacter nicotinovorans]UKF03678.1 DUF6318 family protein [Paenarthrobacter nicotinovorans]GGV44704.1 hypothetical protein GCM10010212_37530 [Paenarthrobacter nicotinovorans]
MSRLSSATLSSILAAVLLSGCQGGSPGTGSSETHTTTASPTSSASSPAASATPSSSGAYKPADAQGKAQNVPVPVMPELAKENSKAGLEVFIRYWFQELSYAYETGNSTKSLELSSSACALCQHLAESIEANYAEEHWLTGGTIRTPVIEVAWDPAVSTQQGKLQVIQQEIRYFEETGSESREFTAATNDAAAFFAEYRQGAWLITDVGIIR